ncbi:TadE family protein [Actinorugispora endophytica]|uniref:TadE-like protein n=1 Tax=Actinorugispora endophytica TaxID=1605990 RepID=A0A4R6V8L6_9ACTN|nr:TadE family protein [Actinorugispora endophytica]TDQ55098.1 TadE-like protein [Actinorugispora endophytica]
MTRGRTERGSASVELTLVAPLLIAFALLMVLAGRVVGAQSTADEIAHAAARAASMERTAPQAQAAADQVAGEALSSHGLVCADYTLALNHGGLQPGGAVTAVLSCHIDLGDLSGLNVPGTRTVQGESTVVVDTYRGTP